MEHNKTLTSVFIYQYSILKELKTPCCTMQTFYYFIIKGGIILCYGKNMHKIKFNLKCIYILLSPVTLTYSISFEKDKKNFFKNIVEAIQWRIYFIVL